MFVFLQDTFGSDTDWSRVSLRNQRECVRDSKWKISFHAHSPLIMRFDLQCRVIKCDWCRSCSPKLMSERARGSLVFVALSSSNALASLNIASVSRLYCTKHGLR